MMDRRTRRTLPLMRGMVWLGVAATVVTVLLRAWLMPAQRDGDTGLFSTNTLVVAVMLAVLAVLAVLGWCLRDDRQEITGRSAMPLSVVSLAVGGVVAVTGVIDLLSWLIHGQEPAPEMTSTTPLSVAVLLPQIVFGILGGIALIRLGLVIASEGGTRRGMAAWSMLAPVLWMWFRLARYEMSYSSTVRLSESFFDFVMFILEMLFLFKLARYTAGVGKVSAGSLLFHAMGTALFAVSAPVVRLCMYLLDDSEAYLASQLAGLTDLAVGVLALTVGIALLRSASAPVQVAEGSSPAAPSVEGVSEASVLPEDTSAE